VTDSHLMQMHFSEDGTNMKISSDYSKVSIIRPGRSRLLEFEKQIVLVV
jgi:hypothetical protein